MDRRLIIFRNLSKDVSVITFLVELSNVIDLKTWNVHRLKAIYQLDEINTRSFLLLTNNAGWIIKKKAKRINVSTWQLDMFNIKVEVTFENHSRFTFAIKTTNSKLTIAIQNILSSALIHIANLIAEFDPRCETWIKAICSNRNTFFITFRSTSTAATMMKKLKAAHPRWSHSEMIVETLPGNQLSIFRKLDT